MRFLKRLLKIVGGIIGVVVLLIAGLVGFLSIKSPASRPPSTEKVAITPERVARGKYLFESVAACAACHTERDYTTYGAPLKAGVPPGSGACWPEAAGLPRAVTCPPNITPHPTAGVGSWTDGELIRAIREGIGRDGRALFMLMPYQSYRSMSDEDVASVVAYIRSMPPSDHKVPPTQLLFPVNLVVKVMPAPVTEPVSNPPASDPVVRGKYLATLASCFACHAETLQGGRSFTGNAGVEVSANISPDPETGIGKVTREEFIGRFKAFANIAPGGKPGREVMSWPSFATMAEEDLGAIYDYLKSRPAVARPVVKSPPG